MKVLLANPRGFCAGVDRAIEIVDQALDQLGAPIYVRHEVVHNEYVVNKLKEKGAIFTDHIEEIPEGATVIFSAHGVSQAVREQASLKKLQIFDATCPLVTKVHIEVARFSKRDYEGILIGHAGHPEVEGTMGQYKNDLAGIYLVENLADVATLSIKNPDKLFFVTQTTLSVDDTADIIDALKQRFPNIQSPKREDICYATTNRQNAVKQLAKIADLVLVVGSITSSNSNRLREVAERLFTESYLIDNAEQINPRWLDNKKTIGVTAGASAPEILVREVIEKLKEYGASDVSELTGEQENIVFALPKELRQAQTKGSFNQTNHDVDV